MVLARKWRWRGWGRYYNFTTNTAKVAGVDLSLTETNVVTVDFVDSVGGPTVVDTRYVDPHPDGTLAGRGAHRDSAGTGSLRLLAVPSVAAALARRPRIAEAGTHYGAVWPVARAVTSVTRGGPHPHAIAATRYTSSQRRIRLIGLLVRSSRAIGPAES